MSSSPQAMLRGVELGEEPRVTISANVQMSSQRVAGVTGGSFEAPNGSGMIEFPLVTAARPTDANQTTARANETQSPSTARDVRVRYDTWLINPYVADDVDSTLGTSMASISLSDSTGNYINVHLDNCSTPIRISIPIRRQEARTLGLDLTH